MREVIDTRGLVCPQPKQMAFEAMYTRRVPEVLVLVDDPAARDGLLRLAPHVGYDAALTRKETHDEVLLVLSERAK